MHSQDNWHITPFKSCNPSKKHGSWHLKVTYISKVNVNSTYAAVTLFGDTIGELPLIQTMGDIVRIHRVNVN
jgi:hypothetical protein